MSVKLSYWDKELKKTKIIQTTIKKHEGDRDKAMEHLQKLKEERLRAIDEKLEKKVEQIVEPVMEPVMEPVLEPVTVETPKIDYSTFKLKLDDQKVTGSSTVLFGASKSGKSYLMKNLLKKYYKNPNTIIILFADNVHSNIYKDIDKKVITTDKFDPQLVKDIHKIQKKTNNKYQWLLVLDDMVLEKSDPQLLKMFLTYRNSKMSTIILLQSLSLLSKNARFNGNNFIFKKCNSQQYVDDVMQYFIGGYGVFAGKSKQEQTELFREITKDYGFCYLDALNDTISYHKNI